MYLLGPLQSQLPKLNVPKKTKVFVDQTLRERDCATCKLMSITLLHLICISFFLYLFLSLSPCSSVPVMHQTFQHQLLQLKVDSAKSYVKTLTTSLTPVTNTKETSLTVSAQVIEL